MEKYFQKIQKACLPPVWSRGVSLSRGDSVQIDKRDASEIILRVRVPNKPISQKVTLWPSAEDEDWFCDCGDKNDPCHHIAAAVITLRALKTGAQNHSASLRYRFTRDTHSETGVSLRFDRYIIRGDQEEKLTQSLISLTGGISSGRIRSNPVSATKEDYAVDYALREDPARNPRPLLAALRECSNIFLDGKPVKTSHHPIGLSVQVTDAQDGFLVESMPESGVTEIFSNGVALCGETLRPLDFSALPPELRKAFAPPGRIYREAEIATLVSQILPELEQKISIEIRTDRLPRVRAMKPELQIDFQALGDGLVGVQPVLVYGAPASARVRADGKIERIGSGDLPLRDLETERKLARQVREQAGLRVGEWTKLSPEQAVALKGRLADRWRVSGANSSELVVHGRLSASIQMENHRLQLSFQISGGNGPALDGFSVLSAWEGGSSLVPLSTGGWAELPKEWLARHADRLARLLRSRDQKVPGYIIPRVAEAIQDAGQELPPDLRKLQDLLSDTGRIPQAKLPEDLQADLRHYQRAGVNWLSFLADAQMGALLADDMGLGKTLQAICSFRGRTLVVCPTSVLGSWEEQIKRFRPGLKICVFHGASRKLEDSAEVTLTSYGVLRLDQELLGSLPWNTAILDEAQTIRNPRSQVARAAHEIRAEHRVALSGTPIENRLEDLWSLFQFLNPGLLGSFEEFQNSVAAPIAGGNTRAAQDLRSTIRPFVLRRLKREVASELPPRTETILQCELSNEEQELYDALLASTRSEVLEKLESGSGSVFAALELLLRLRQACCHPALLPGQTAKHSSKLQVLMNLLEESISEGHRSLVFSQWTSHLDLIEPHLKEAGFNFLRLDGSTQHRQAIVDRFQDPEGPPVLLMSLKAGGVGLTLTAADHVFLMDPWWNPAAEQQAADRAHRIGQTQPVVVHRLVAKGTVEERILELQKRKLALADAALEGSGGAAGLTRDDIARLLA